MIDPTQQLREADPARRAPLDDIDPAAWATLRQGVLTGAGLPAPATVRTRRRWRLGRNATLALGLGVALTAGGAVAVIPGFIGGAVDGPNCLLTWGDPDGLVVGPYVSGDPVQDCTLYWEQAGIEPPADATAFSYQGMVYVTPADQVPSGVTDLNGEPVLTPAEMELSMSTMDTVDGGRATCRSVEDQAAWAQSELNRLGLADSWTVEIGGYPDQPPYSEGGIDRPCAFADDFVRGTVSIFPDTDFTDPATGSFPNGNWRADLLRERITDQCLTVDQARAVADELLDDEEHHWPTSSVVDESAACARVDLAIGGSIQITVYGPTSVG